MARDLIDGLADQREEIILEPDLIEFVGHPQNQGVLVDLHGLDGRKPTSKQFRIEHSLQDFARVSPQLLVPSRHHSSVIAIPDLFTACQHFFCAAAPSANRARDGRREETCTRIARKQNPSCVASETPATAKITPRNRLLYRCAVAVSSHNIRDRLGRAANKKSSCPG